MLWFLEHYGIAYAVAALCLLEIIIKGMVHRTYCRLEKAAGNIGKSKHRLMKSLRVKFDTCYQLKIGVPNVEIFVEKYLRHYRVFGLHLLTWENVCNLCMLLTMLISLGGGIFTLYLGMTPEVVFISLGCGIAGNGVILLFDCLYGVNNKRELLRVDILDFLENIYKPRLENETFHSQMLEEYQQEYFEETGRDSKVVSLNGREEGKFPEYPIEFTKEEEEVIRDVIREYMG